MNVESCHFFTMLYSHILYVYYMYEELRHQSSFSGKLGKVQIRHRSIFIIDTSVVHDSVSS